MDLWPRWDLNPLFLFSHYKYFLSLNSQQIFPLFKYYHLLLTIVDAILYMKFILGRLSWLECWRVIAGHRVGSNWLCSTVPRTISGVSHQGAVRQTSSSKGEGHLKMRWPFAFPQAHYQRPFCQAPSQQWSSYPWPSRQRPTHLWPSWQRSSRRCPFRQGPFCEEAVRRTSSSKGEVRLELIWSFASINSIQIHRNILTIITSRSLGIVSHRALNLLSHNKFLSFCPNHFLALTYSNISKDECLSYNLILKQ